MAEFRGFSGEFRGSPAILVFPRILLMVSDCSGCGIPFGSLFQSGFSLLWPWQSSRFLVEVGINLR
jgi:hypothetical protein